MTKYLIPVIAVVGLGVIGFLALKKTGAQQYMPYMSAGDAKQPSAAEDANQWAAFGASIANTVSGLAYTGSNIAADWV